MALTDNPFIGLPLADIQALQTMTVQAIKDVLLTGKSNAFPGWSITRADLRDLRQQASDLRIALDVAAGAGGVGKQIAYATVNTSRQFSGRVP